ncbi:unnamed protein product [Hydatigera taeniaeformis]|uniref:Conserved oligomeric Golgi complex subunit 7 n=1 Tax=Hydatigena taeniaeformis TaxID=6205 RepID=A0A0R3X5R7_HYDTA|nr:unnamed protein product [Hydatigera taeniaeformis]
MEDCDSGSGSSGSEIEVDEGVVEEYCCLLCDHKTTAVSEFFQHLEEIHHWDLRQEGKLFADQYTWISFVNWTRINKPPHWKDFLAFNEEDRQTYLQPFIQDDAVLMIVDKSVLNIFRNFIKQGREGLITGKVVLNLFEDAGMISLFLAKADAKRVFIPASPFVESVKALAKCNNCEEKIEVVSSLAALPVNRIDILFWDWLDVFFLNCDQSDLFSLIQSKVNRVYPRALSVDVIGVTTKQEVLKCLVPSCSFEDLNTAPLVVAAYEKVYQYDWNSDLVMPVTNAQAIVTVDIQNTLSFRFDEKNFQLTFNTAAKMNGLLIYLRCEIDGNEWSFSTKDSGSYGQSLILLRHPVDGLPGQEARDFLADDFDHKALINRTLQSVSSEPNTEAAISSILLNTANQEVESTFHEVAQAMPRILRNIESVNQQAILLRDHMDSVEKDFRKMHIDDSDVIRELERLDCQRQRAKKAADALREANRWSMLVNSRQALMEGDANVDQLYQLILDMDQSLIYLEQMPDYADRKALLNATKDRLEALIAPQFMELLDAITQSADSRLLEQLQHMITIFGGLNRSSVAVRYYVTWLENRLKENWDRSTYITMDKSPFADQSVGRVHCHFRDTITFLSSQLELRLFGDESRVPLLRALANSMETVSPQVSQFLMEQRDSSNSSLNRCSDMLKYTDESAILDDFQTTSDQLYECLVDLLSCAISQTKGIGLSSLLDAVHETTKLLVEQWQDALESFANSLIEQDRAMHYKQADGMKTVLLLVSATGALAMKIGDFVMSFDDHLQRLFSQEGSKTLDCASRVCPFHSLLLPLIGESQPCANWSFLLSFAPQSDLLKSPVDDSSNPIMPTSVLTTRLADLCKASVTIAERVALTPVDDILAVVPKMTLWASHPAGGDAKLPDLAYLPQEYITQLGQYIFNLPEHLLPFMDTNEDANSTSLEQSAALVHCLRLTDSRTCQVQSNAVAAGSRSRLSSSAEAVSSSSTITAWLDWLLSGQVAEAFVKAILAIPSPAPVPSNVDKPPPGLTAHGAKQLLTDLDYFLGLLEELGLPRPVDLVSLRDLINASPEEFKKVSADKSPRVDSVTQITLKVVPPYWEPFGDRKHFLWKSCTTAAACEAEKKRAGRECMREWYMDWRCVECCQGELCNYYATGPTLLLVDALGASVPGMAWAKSSPVKLPLNEISLNPTGVLRQIDEAYIEQQLASTSF